MQNNFLILFFVFCNGNRHEDLCKRINAKVGRTADLGVIKYLLFYSVSF